jgi:hypothetical protein
VSRSKSGIILGFREKRKIFFEPFPNFKKKCKKNAKKIEKKQKKSQKKSRKKSQKKSQNASARRSLESACSQLENGTISKTKEVSFANESVYYNHSNGMQKVS